MPEAIITNVGGKLTTAIADFTRPANTTAYTAGDVVSNSISATTLMKFTNVVRFKGGSGYIAKARVETDKKDETAQYRLILYTVPETAIVTGGPTVTVPADNAPDTTIFANHLYHIGYIDFPAMAAGADTTNNTAARAQWSGPFLAFTCYAGGTNIPGDSSIYGKLVNMTGTTPASGQNFHVSLTVDQN